jgi:ATP-dependent Clp protease ATP-binding subunit ClpA
MFERYTESARRALFFARYETTQLRGTAIETEHLLLGLLRVSSGLTTQLFGRANLSYGDAIREVGPPDSTAPKVSLSTEIPFTHETRRALEQAADEADRLGHSEIGVEHLILGLLQVRDSLAASILERHGMSLDGERDLIASLLNDAAVDTEDGLGDAQPSLTYESRVILERVGRIEKYLQQLVASLSANHEALEVIAQIHMELQNMKPLGHEPFGFGYGQEEEG